MTDRTRAIAYLSGKMRQAVQDLHSYADAVVAQLDHQAKLRDLTDEEEALREGARRWRSLVENGEQ
jgi:hypothetical protein